MEQYFKICPLLLHLKQRLYLMCCFYLIDFSWVYFRVLVLIFIVFGSLWVLYGWGAEYQGMYFGAKCNMSLYKLLIILMQTVIVFGSLIFIRAIFSLGFKDSTSQLIKTDSFHPVSLA